MFHLDVSTRAITVIDREILTTGSVGIKCHLDFSEDWEGLNRIAVFNARRASDQETISRTTIMNSDVVEIPWECLVDVGTLTIGVYGSNTDGKIVIPTIYMFLGNIQVGAEPLGEDAHEKLPTIAEQVLEMMNNAQEIAKESKRLSDEVYRAYEAGELNGIDYDHSEEYQQLSERIAALNQQTDNTWIQINTTVSTAKTDINKIVTDAKNDFDTNVANEISKFNANASAKTNDYNSNATSKTNTYNANATQKTSDFNSNATQKTTAFNTNATQKTEDFNALVARVKTEVGAQVQAATTQANNAKTQADRAQEIADTLETSFLSFVVEDDGILYMYKTDKLNVNFYLNEVGELIYEC